MITCKVGRKTTIIQGIDIDLDGLSIHAGQTPSTPTHITIPWRHLYAAKFYEEEAILKLYYLELLQHDPFPVARRQKLALHSEQHSELIAIAERITAQMEDKLKPRYLVIINPFGGEKQAMKIYESTVKPMLREAQIEHDLSLTEYRTHAKLLANSVKKELYQGLLVVGGDGLLHECINGLLSRRDWATTPDFHLGIIPAGTSNAIARSLGVSDPVWAVLTIIKGTTDRMDAMLFEQDNRRFYGHFACMWGLFADIDLGSEPWRCLGRNRLYCSTITQLLRLRKYQAQISFIPLLNQNDGGETSIPPMGTTMSGPERPMPRYKQYFDLPADKQDSQYPVQSWEEGEYYSFLALKHPWLDRDVCVSPHMTMTPDVIELFALPHREVGVTRAHFFRALMNEDASEMHGDPRLCAHAKVRACKIRFAKKPTEDPSLDIDGEEVPKADIYFESLPNILTIFSSPPPTERVGGGS